MDLPSRWPCIADVIPLSAAEQSPDRLGGKTASGVDKRALAALNKEKSPRKQAPGGACFPDYVCSPFKDVLDAHRSGQRLSCGVFPLAAVVPLQQLVGSFVVDHLLPGRVPFEAAAEFQREHAEETHGS